MLVFLAQWTLQRLKEECSAVVSVPLKDFTLWELSNGKKAAHLEKQLSSTIQEATLAPEQQVLVEEKVRCWEGRKDTLVLRSSTAWDLYCLRLA